MRSADHILGKTLRLGFMLAMVAGIAFMGHAGLAYLEEGDMHPFILEKLPLPNERLWTGALYVHLVAAAAALPGCLLLTSRALLRHLPRVHRWLGRLVGLVVLLALVPSGSYLAFFARGGLPSTIGFLLSGAIVVWAMGRAIAAARRKQFAQHRRYAAHVVAQMSVAVSSRVLLVLAAAADLAAEPAYIAALWLPVVASALVAEWMFAPRTVRPALGSRRNHESVDPPALRLDPAR